MPRPDPLDLLILALATWRLASLLVAESGPFDLFERLRTAAGVRYDARSRPYGTGLLSGILSCVYCASVWLGAALALAYGLFGPVTAWLALPFALSAAACWIEARTGEAD